MVIIINRRKDEQLGVFEISESQFKKLKVESIESDSSCYNDYAVDLYKMEYERCAQRYDDLYKAAWTNFSYIALVAGAILTFGSGRFMPEFSIFLATVPLLFWWLASFEPLNRYGDQVQARAAWIESLLNEILGTNKQALEGLSEDQKQLRNQQRGLQHFAEFEKRRFRIDKPLEMAAAILFWLAVITFSSLFFYPQIPAHLESVIVWYLLFLMLSFFLIWFFGTADRLELSRFFRVRFVVRLFAGLLITVAICSILSAVERHASGDSFINRSVMKSEATAGVFIRL